MTARCEPRTAPGGSLCARPESGHTLK
ncbi:hypothetical protein CBM2615_A120046 [Cupriavidus taiwanensis]|uniref:Uncharacterized protein n=1 Tax=Cupriavidus taiwanensis TaxID=164546 RepID=A0A976G0K7_9BURK|nr:hypothetical protein CBM2614_A120045 [Cupriavidus taiwanensis]SOZ49158.1 hypothetical protein CBM2615_A120046 [Cupriavidus taiwanensis]SOZ51823.1 hypothetical protein CBM2613_A110046 [Cupriavidus taiwanensis]